MRYVLGLDPGTTHSALVLTDLELERVEGRWLLNNPQALMVLEALASGSDVPEFENDELATKGKNAVQDAQIRKRLKLPMEYPKPEFLVVEMIASYNQAVGRSTFETCAWLGRFISGFCGGHRLNYTLITRTQIRMQIAGTMRSGDPQVRRALLDRIGEAGTAKNPGPLYGMKSDLFSALAAAIAFKDFELEYQHVMRSPRAEKARQGLVKIKSFHTLLEADGGDVTLSWPLREEK